MKNSAGVLFAAIAGAVIVLAAVVLNNVLNSDISEEDDGFANGLYGTADDDDNHGIEYLAMS